MRTLLLLSSPTSLAFSRAVPLTLLTCTLGQIINPHGRITPKLHPCHSHESQTHIHSFLNISLHVPQVPQFYWTRIDTTVWAKIHSDLYFSRCFLLKRMLMSGLPCLSCSQEWPLTWFWPVSYKWKFAGNCRESPWFSDAEAVSLKVFSLSFLPASWNRDLKTETTIFCYKGKVKWIVKTSVLMSLICCKHMDLLLDKK